MPRTEDFLETTRPDETIIKVPAWRRAEGCDAAMDPQVEQPRRNLHKPALTTGA